MNTTQHGYYDNKEKIITRLRRIEGQVRGLERMVKDDTYCIDILTQVTAAQAAIDKVAVELLRDHARHCMTAHSSAEDQQTKADELVRAVSRMMSR